MDWLSRWEQGNTGWHETAGNAALHRFWPQLAPASRVLVPLCGKSVDLLWLADQGCDVTGVEFSAIAARAFFEEAGIAYEIDDSGGAARFRASQRPITIACGDYFEFSDEAFDALYDRASLIALPPGQRPAYIDHTKGLLKPDATQLLVTLEYDQSRASGPPYSVLADEVRAYWSNLRRVSTRNDIEYSAPKFRQAGIIELNEVVWLSG